MELGGFKLRGSGSAQILSTFSGKTVCRTGNFFEVQERTRGPL